MRPYFAKVPVPIVSFAKVPVPIVSFAKYGRIDHLKKFSRSLTKFLIP